VSGRGRVLRLTDVEPETVRTLQLEYADLLTRYIALGQQHVELMEKYHDLLERHLCKTTLVP
jgi:hypothetical protein